MIDQERQARVARELRHRAVEEPTIEQVLAEAAGHTAACRRPPLEIFGLPEAYAAQIASSLRLREPAARRREPGPVRLAASGIGKRFGRGWVLREVDLAVRAGQVAAVVGANGAGKSTFLRICAGFVSPDAGTVLVDGAIGYCPQHGGTLDHLRPDEHFALLGTGRGGSRAAARRVGTALAATLQWNAGERVQARHLSGGTRQKLNLVLAALGDPGILLLDEPYQGFDQGTYLDFWDQVFGWRDQGRAIVVVTHLMENMEGVLLLLAVISAQFLIDPARTLGRFMPFWSARELGTYAVDLTDAGYLHRGVAHAAGTATLLFVLTALLAAVRLRRRGHLRIVPPGTITSPGG